MTVDQNNTEALRQQLDAAQSSEDQVRIVAEFVLRRLGADSDARRKTSSEVVDYAFGSLGLEMPVARNTFVNYLSTVARSAHSAIVVAGRGRGAGYFLSSGPLDMVEKAQVRPEESSRTYTRTEEALYPIFQRWLMAQGYRAKTTASMRSLGKWSNPDVRASASTNTSDASTSISSRSRPRRTWSTGSGCSLRRCHIAATPPGHTSRSPYPSPDRANCRRRCATNPNSTTWVSSRFS